MVEDKEYLKKLLCTPPIKKIDLHFPLGLEVTARNLKGVTIKDALDAIYKQYKKKVSHISIPPAHYVTSTQNADYTRPTGRRRARGAIPGGLRVGQGGILHQVHRAPEEDGRGSHEHWRQEEEGQERRCAVSASRCRVHVLLPRPVAATHFSWRQCLELLLADIIAEASEFLSGNS